MPLSNNSQYGVRPLTEAINKLPNNPTIIRQLGIFTPKYHTTTFVKVGEKEGKLSLISAVPRGTPGEPVKEKYNNIGNFDMIHLPKDDVVRADDVQNVATFGSDNKAETVAEKVNDKLDAMKSDIEYTREHLMLGALQGKILDADGTTLVDIYDRFKLTRRKQTISFTKTANVVQALEAAKNTLRKHRGGEAVNGWICLCSAEFFAALTSHASIAEIYLRHQAGQIYRDGLDGEFRHAGIRFVQYDHEFESGAKIEDGDAIILPAGTRSTFREHFAPADMNSTVNTKAKPYYASREKLEHDKGWSLQAQSNPLPLVHRPELVMDLKSS